MSYKHSPFDYAGLGFLSVGLGTYLLGLNEKISTACYSLGAACVIIDRLLPHNILPEENSSDLEKKVKE